MVTGVGNATLYKENLVKGYLTIPKKPGVRPISIPHPLGWGGRTQFDLGKWNYRAIPKVKTWSYFLTIPKHLSKTLENYLIWKVPDAAKRDYCWHICLNVRVSFANRLSIGITRNPDLFRWFLACHKVDNE